MCVGQCMAQSGKDWVNSAGHFVICAAHVLLLQHGVAKVAAARLLLLGGGGLLLYFTEPALQPHFGQGKAQPIAMVVLPCKYGVDKGKTWGYHCGSKGPLGPRPLYTCWAVLWLCRRELPDFGRSFWVQAKGISWLCPRAVPKGPSAQASVKTRTTLWWADALFAE